jgi:hypothetical protein
LGRCAAIFWLSGLIPKGPQGYGLSPKFKAILWQYAGIGRPPKAAIQRPSVARSANAAAQWGRRGEAPATLF